MVNIVYRKIEATTCLASFPELHIDGKFKNHYNAWLVLVASDDAIAAFRLELINEWSEKSK